MGGEEKKARIEEKIQKSISPSWRQKLGDGVKKATREIRRHVCTIQQARFYIANFLSRQKFCRTGGLFRKYDGATDIKHLLSTK